MKDSKKEGIPQGRRSNGAEWRKVEEKVDRVLCRAERLTGCCAGLKGWQGVVQGRKVDRVLCRAERLTGLKE